MNQIINGTPHAINLNDGQIFLPGSVIARIDQQYTQTGPVGGVPTWNINTTGSNIDQFPSVDGVFYIVSGQFADYAFRTHRRVDFISPATGHKDCIRHTDGPAKGQIKSVPGFISPSGL